LKLTVIVPVYNAGENLRSCLKALSTSTRPPDELIVVDDASTDGAVQVASRFGACVLIAELESPVGPAKSRNRGAAIAKGEVLVFIDADVAVHQNTLAMMEKIFLENPEVAALFGSYDDSPPHRDLVSLYKNLQHHFVHQHGNPVASTFWAGAGAIRRDIFIELGGFDESYSRPSIEDIELGVRLRRIGYRVCLCPEIQVTHLKRWTFTSLIRSDILDRAIPWTQLILSTSQLPDDLNVAPKSRVSALIVWMILLLVILGFWFHLIWVSAVLIFGVFVSLNRTLYSFFLKKGGFWFASGAVGLHMLYLIYSSTIFGSAFIWKILSGAFRRTGRVINLKIPVEKSYDEP